MKALLQTTNDMPFKLIIGLGNDESAYANTHHNVGHLFIDYLHKHRPELRAEKTEGFMNESGASVKKIMKCHNATPNHTLIAHDESDLFLGEYKISVARGAAGHKGVQNVFDTSHTNTFTRLRIGIRPRAADQRGPNADFADGLPRESAFSQRESAPRVKAETFVLKTISATNRKILEHTFEQAATELFGALNAP